MVPSPDIVTLPALIAAAMILLALLTPRRRRRRRAAGTLARWLWSQRLSTSSHTARAGRAGERKVARTLSRLGMPSLHDVYLPIGEDTTQIDHVVLVGGVIVVLETKHMAGLVIGRSDAPMWTQAVPGRRRRFRNPIQQNAVHLDAVALACRPVPILGLVVFSASAKLKVLPPDAVARLGDLPAILEALAERHPATRRSERAWADLTRAANSVPVEVSRRRHVATLARLRS